MSSSKNEGLGSSIKRAHDSFNKTLKDAGLEDVNELFSINALLLAIILGALFVFYSLSPITPLSLGLGILIFGLIGLVISFPLVGFVAPIYKKTFNTNAEIKAALGYQILALFLAIVLGILFQSTVILYAGLLAFAILIIVYPALQAINTNTKVVKDFNKTLKYMDLFLSIAIPILSSLLHIAHLI